MFDSLKFDRRGFAATLSLVAASHWELGTASENSDFDLRQTLDEVEIWSLDTRWVKVDTKDRVSFRREVRYNGRWRFSGETLPVRKSDHRVVDSDVEGWLDPRVVPKEVRGFEVTFPLKEGEESILGFRHPSHLPDDALRARHGLPPSHWIRSRDAKQLRRWLKTIDVPLVGVEQITFWDHLVLHHEFKPERIEGLSRNELAMLHSAAHYGY